MAMGAAIMAAVGVSVMQGCLHANLPGATENSLAATDPNVFPAPKLMALSLEYVANRYPPAGGAGDGSTATFAFNLPEGMNEKSVALIESMLEGRGVRVTPENAGTLPVYHIVTMWIRGTRATVEMVYPFPELGLTSGAQPIYRGVSLTLAQDLSPWRVQRQQLWTVGTIEVPPIRYVSQAAVESPASEPAAEPAAGTDMNAPEAVVPMADDDAAESPSSGG
jgi:hypothetical protein